MQNKKEIVNWISTVIAIALGIFAIIGWFKESGKNEAVAINLVAQTQKQWELRQSDQIKINKLEQDVATLKSDVKWLEKGHKTIDANIK